MGGQCGDSNVPLRCACPSQGRGPREPRLSPAPRKPTSQGSTIDRRSLAFSPPQALGKDLGQPEEEKACVVGPLQGSKPEHMPRGTLQELLPRGKTQEEVTRPDPVRNGGECFHPAIHPPAHPTIICSKQNKGHTGT